MSNHYSNHFEVEAQKYIEALCEESGFHEYNSIKDWIENNKREAIVEFMRDDKSWKHIAHDKLTVDDIESADQYFFRKEHPYKNVLEKSIDRILFDYFCDTLTDMNYEIDTWVENLPPASEAGEDDRAYDAMRTDNCRAEF